MEHWYWKKVKKKPTGKNTQTGKNMKKTNWKNIYLPANSYQHFLTTVCNFSPMVPECPFGHAILVMPFSEAEVIQDYAKGNIRRRAPVDCLVSLALGTAYCSLFTWI